MSEIVERFQHFHNQKGLPNEPSDRLLQRLGKVNDQKKLVVSCCSINNEKLVFHVYFVDNNRASLMMSFSDFREKNEISKMIGKINRYLHWKDIIYFRRNGFICYDWGGINENDESFKNITSFKKGFGGSEIDVYEGFAASTIRGRIYLSLRKLLKK